MYSGFPLDQLGLLCCVHDGEELEVAEATEGASGRVLEGSLRCLRCDSRFPVRSGIVRMLDEAALAGESRHEWRLRDEEATTYDTFVADPIANEMEMQPTIDALALRPDAICFELGCGTGRYTVRIASRCRTLLAVDFSERSLLIVAGRLGPDAEVGLVQADVTRLRLAPRRFDRGLSTLVSNLPDRAAREAMYRLAAKALHAEGRFIFGTHYYGLFQRMRGVRRQGAYSEGGIYRYYFSRREIAAEVRPSFRAVRVLPVQIPVPLGRLLGLPVVKISRSLGRVPLVNQSGNLLLVTASAPMPSDTMAARPNGAAPGAAL